MPKLPIALNNRRGVRLQITPERLIEFGEQSARVGRLYSLHVTRQRQWLPILEIPATIRTIQRCLIGHEDETSEGVTRPGYPREISPCSCRIAGVHTDGIAVNTADWLPVDL